MVATRDLAGRIVDTIIATSPRGARHRLALEAHIDVGVTKTFVVADAHPTASGRCDCRFDLPRHAISLAFLDALVVVAGRPAERNVPAAIGIGALGPLDPISGAIEYSTNLLRVDPLLARSPIAWGAPASMNDDGNTGALGEAIAGAGRGADSVCVPDARDWA